MNEIDDFFSDIVNLINYPVDIIGILSLESVTRGLFNLIVHAS